MDTFHCTYLPVEQQVLTLTYCFLVVHKVNTRLKLSFLSRPKLLEGQILVLDGLNYYIFPPLFRLRLNTRAANLDYPSACERSALSMLPPGGGLTAKYGKDAIGSLANYAIKSKIKIYFYKMIQ